MAIKRHGSERHKPFTSNKKPLREQGLRRRELLGVIEGQNCPKVEAAGIEPAFGNNATDNAPCACVNCQQWRRCKCAAFWRLSVARIGVR